MQLKQTAKSEKNYDVISNYQTYIWLLKMTSFDTIDSEVLITCTLNLNCQPVLQCSYKPLRQFRAT